MAGVLVAGPVVSGLLRKNGGHLLHSILTTYITFNFQWEYGRVPASVVPAFDD
jgi:hypothetical protein